MKLRFLGGRYQGRLLELPGDSFTIGRGRRNDLTLDQDGVSRYHCVLTREKDQWYVEDLESTNGVRLNGHRIAGKQPVRVGDRIGISENLLLLTDESSDLGALPLEGGRQAHSLRVEQPTVKDTTRRSAPTHGHDGQPPQQDLFEDEAPFPWVRIVLLALVVLLLLWLGIDHVLDSRREANASDDDRPTEQVEESEPDRLVEAPPAPSVDPATESSTEAPPSPSAEDPAKPPDEPPSPVEPPEPEPMPWYAVIRSVPEGAIAVVDDVEIGPTPVVAKLAPGRHRLKLTREGYETMQRLIDDDVLYPREPFPLRQQAGTLLVKSVPSGATVLHGRRLLGKTPALIRTLPPGNHTLTLVEHGYGPEELTVTTSDIRSLERTVELTARLGTLNVVTFPPGCQVFVDGVAVGETQPAEDQFESAPLSVNDLLAGQHEVRVVHPIGGEETATANVSPGAIIHRSARFWFPDHLVTLKNGQSIHGYLLYRDRDGELALLNRRRKVLRFETNAVEAVEELPPEIIRRLLERAPETPDEPSTNPAPDTGGEGGLPRPGFRMSAREFQATVEESTPADLRRQFGGETVRLTGTPGRMIATDQVLNVWLARSVRCQLDVGDLPAVRGAKMDGKSLSIQGTVTECNAEEVILADCRIAPAP